MPPRPAKPSPVSTVQPVAPSTAAAPPSWLRTAILVLAAIFLVGAFSREITDTDTWWHLKTGQYIVQQRKLPIPDTFAYTTYTGKPAYPGEETTRDFNLTHEWITQAIFYLVYALGGIPGLVAARALAMTAVCGMVGLLVYRRQPSFWRAVGGTLAAAALAYNFAVDRPQIVSYFFVLLTIWILENRKWMWVLPPLFLLWANAHGGFILGWVVLGIYCAEAIFFRLRGKPLAEERQMLLCSIGAVLISGLNPNGFKVVPVLLAYRKSAMQTTIYEWLRPKYWEMSPYAVLLYATGATLLLAFKRTRPVDWLLYAAFGISSLMAYRNIIWIGFVGAWMLATYLPSLERGKSQALDWVLAVALTVAALFAVGGIVPMVLAIAGATVVWFLWSGKSPMAAELAAAAMLLVSSMSVAAMEKGFQFRAADWRFPSGAADFLLSHHVTGHIYNTYELGGYLIWRLAPEQKVFVDGRALNEGVYDDTKRIAFNADNTGGKSAEELLQQYGIDTIVMGGFDYTSGNVYLLPAALSDPSQKAWKLVYQDAKSVVFMRNPPAGVQPLNSFETLASLESQCTVWMEHFPQPPTCAHGMVNLFTLIGDRARAAKWMEIDRRTQ